MDANDDGVDVAVGRLADEEGVDEPWCDEDEPDGLLLLLLDDLDADEVLLPLR
jgi:hypothetical protein